MTEFRFSPRENRAHEIGWMPWGEDAFARARAEDKPILLSISAVWCHWCHVMDETSYSDPAVIAAIKQLYVPVRVDNDKRPDVNARYNMGGWPTTAFLTPDGATLAGATYLPPEQMRHALDEIAEFYATKKEQIEERARDLASRRSSYQPADPSELREAAVIRLIEELSEGYDREYGGFGDAPKFPQPEMLELLLMQWRLRGDARLYEMVAKTMNGMSRGGMYDHVEGGFFRYSTTRDWSVPHFEKMAEDHAGLLRVLALQLTFAPTGEVRETLVSALNYVRTVLRDPQTAFFAGSQDADETYYELPLDQRRALPTPFVDRTSYTNWTCGLAGAFALAGRALDDDLYVNEAMETLDRVAEQLSDPDGLLYHVLAPESAPSVRGLLTDQVAYVRALLDTHEASGEPRFLARAVAMADRIIARFAGEDGGFYDRIAIERSIGRLDIPDRPIVDGGIFAEALLRLSALTGEPRFRAEAERTLALYARTYAAAASFASAYARALTRYLGSEITVRIVGTPAGTAGFREAGFRLPTPLVSIATMSAEEAAAHGIPAEPAPAAYVCVGTVCAAPALEPGGVRAAYESLETSSAGRRT